MSAPKSMNIRAIRGTKDILPGEAGRWVAVENLARDLFARYGYSEIRTPVIEETALFTRSVGEATDIVQKQMYSFSDRGERSITLRPEGTAPVVRAYIEHSLDRKQQLTKLFYMGPMFRAERPQAGRQRQFHQIGVEAIGSASPYLDAEVISLLANFLKQAGANDFELKINNLGCDKDKGVFVDKLKKGLKPNLERLCEDCQSRFEKNTLRILDCKNPDCKKIVGAIHELPLHCKDCAEHFEKVRQGLDLLSVKYAIDNNLVRGLDYYTGTVFEVSSSKLGSQDAIAAGGRYDNLIKDLGGPGVPAIGFAIGVERLLMAISPQPTAHSPQPNIYIATLGDAARKKGFELAGELRKSGIAFSLNSLSSMISAIIRIALANISLLLSLH